MWKTLYGFLFQKRALQAEEELTRGRTKLRFVSIDGVKCIAQGIFHVQTSKFFTDKQGSRSKVSFVQLIRLKDKQGV